MPPARAWIRSLVSLTGLTLLLAGCLKLDMDITLSPDDTVDGEVVFAVNKEMLELTGQNIDDMLGDTAVPDDVEGATSDESARRIALSIANSPLVKTAIAGEDANWGRVVMAVGKAGEPADRDKLSIAFGDFVVAERGERATTYDEAAASAYMKNEELELRVDLNLGSGTSTVFTCDLTHGYIDINGSYRS